MENQSNDPTVKTPWEWLGEIATQVIRKKQREHSRPSDGGLIYAGIHDFEEKFEIPLRILIAKTELKIYRKLAEQAPPGLGQLCLDKQAELDNLYFEMAQRDRPDGH